MRDWPEQARRLARTTQHIALVVGTLLCAVACAGMWGFTIDDAVSEEIRENAGRFAQFSSTKALFLPDGAVPGAGSRLRNPDLARTYRQIGREGVGALYGPLRPAPESSGITSVP